MGCVVLHHPLAAPPLPPLVLPVMSAKALDSKGGCGSFFLLAVSPLPQLLVDWLITLLPVSLAATTNALGESHLDWRLIKSSATTLAHGTC